MGKDKVNYSMIIEGKNISGAGHAIWGYADQFDAGACVSIRLFPNAASYANNIEQGFRANNQGQVKFEFTGIPSGNVGATFLIVAADDDTRFTGEKPWMALPDGDPPGGTTNCQSSLADQTKSNVMPQPQQIIGP